MTRWRPHGLLVALVLAAASTAATQESPGAPTRTLTLDDALDLARAQAPEIRVARARVDEARGELVAASVPLAENPELEIGGGPRTAPGSTTLDVDVGLAQSFELGGRRDARIDSARAGIDGSTAVADEEARRVLRDVAVAFLLAVHAEERVRIAEDAERLAIEIHGVAARRHEAGDVGLIDVNLAALALAGVQAEARLAGVERDRALDDLRLLLGIPPDQSVAVEGELLDRRRYELDALLARVPDRADLRVLDAALGRAEADGRLAAGSRRPDLGVRVGYAREEEADIVTGAVSVSLPMFDRGQGGEAIAQARADAVRVERDAVEASARGEIVSAHGAYLRLLDAAERFEADGLPLVEQSEALARRGYEVGAMALGELLAVRRELSEARITHADLLLAAALAGVELESEAGVLR